MSVVARYLHEWRTGLTSGLQNYKVTYYIDMATEQKAEVVQTSDNLDELGIKGLPRDRAVGWFKFTNIGDAVGGEVKDMFYAPENDGMPAQRVFTVERKNGELWNVGLKYKQYVITRTDQVQVGDRLGCRLEKIIPASKKGFNPAKSISVMPELIGPRTGNNAAKLASPSAVVAGAHADDHADTSVSVGDMTGDPLADDEDL